MQLQIVIAAVLVALSAVYAVWRLLSAGRRLWLLERLLPAARERTRVGRWRASVRKAALADAARGCQGCAPGSRARRWPDSNS
ncbi:MAG TPA: hypothetical protein VMG11_10530 [Steroidobacteraceae bacterium]|nr:hypothetical protein [Steroidobacteraceae bacterium]